MSEGDGVQMSDASRPQVRRHDVFSVIELRTPISKAAARINQESLAVGKYDFVEAPDGPAGLGGPDIDRDHVAGLQRVPVPAQQGDRWRAANFRRPVCDVTLLILHVEHHDRVRIGPMDCARIKDERVASPLMANDVGMPMANHVKAICCDR